MKNLFHDLPSALSGEVFTSLLQHPSLRIERIVSQGQQTPAGQWLCQDHAEWVILLAGRATLIFQDAPDQDEHLEPGSFVLISSRRAHRVEWTSPNEPAVWLAVHYQ